MYIYLYAFECLLSFPLTKTAEWQLKRLDNNNGCYCSCDTIIVPPHQEAVSTALEGTVNKKARDLLKEIFGGTYSCTPIIASNPAVPAFFLLAGRKSGTPGNTYHVILRNFT